MKKLLLLLLFATPAWAQTNMGLFENILDHGALCNNSTNDGPAINATIGIQTVRGGTVRIPAKNCAFDQIVLKTSVLLEGSGNGSPEATTDLNQLHNVNKDGIISDPATDFGFQQFGGIEHLRLFQNVGANTIGNGIHFKAVAGEGVKFQDLIIEAFPENCILFSNGAEPLLIEDVHLSLCGKYGIEVNTTHHGNQLLQFKHISGDQDKSGLIHINVGAKTGSIAIVIDGVKAELAPGTAALTLDGGGVTVPIYVWVNGMTLFSASTASSAIRINSPHFVVHYCGVSVNGPFGHVVDGSAGIVSDATCNFQ